jgi:hypothetical protein
MSGRPMLREAQMRRIEPYFPLSHGGAESGRPPGAERDPVRNPQWASLAGRAQRLGASQNDLQPLHPLEPHGSVQPHPRRAQQGKRLRPADDRRNHLKAHRTAASLLKKGLYPDVSDAAAAG